MEEVLSKIKSNVKCPLAVFAGLCIFAFGINLSVSIMEIGLGLAFVCWIVTAKKKNYQNLTIRNPLFIPWTAYILAALAACVFALDKTRSINYLPSDLIKMGGCLFLLTVINKTIIKPVIFCYILGAVVSAFWGISEVVRQYFFASGLLVRANAAMNAVTYGELITLVLLFSIVGYTKTPKTNKIKYFFLGLIFLFGVSLLLSQSRGAIIGGVFSMILLWIMEKHTRKILAFLAVAAVLFIAMLSLKNSEYAGRMFPVVKIFNTVKTDSPKTGKTLKEQINKTSSSRIVQWTAAAKIIKDYPFFGVGPSNIKTIFNFYHPNKIDGQFGWSNVHNLYLHQAAERGLIGLSALLYLLGFIFVLAWRAVKKYRNKYTIWCLCALPGFFVMNLTETSFQHSVVSFNIFLMLAASWAACKEIE